MTNRRRKLSSWNGLQSLPPHYYQCGYCGASVAPNQGYHTDEGTNVNTCPLIYICSGCLRPTFFHLNSQTPSPSLGSSVLALPQAIQEVYEEARRCSTVSAYTSAVLACRKLIVHIAVDKGAKENLGFAEYIDFLAEKGYVPPDGREWVEQIRIHGNEATHEIVLKSAEAAEEVIGFVEMLLRFIYEFPSRVRKPPVSI